MTTKEELNFISADVSSLKDLVHSVKDRLKQLDDRVCQLERPSLLKKFDKVNLSKDVWHETQVSLIESTRNDFERITCIVESVTFMGGLGEDYYYVLRVIDSETTITRFESKLGLTSVIGNVAKTEKK